MDITTQIIEYETGELNEEETTKMFAELIKNGMAWTLQGHYGRTATAYISAGIIDREGNIL
jgi:hypothetical protein